MDEQSNPGAAGDSSGEPPALTPFMVGPAGEAIVVAPVTAVSRTSRRKTFGVVLSAFALICASVFVVTTLASSDGSASPEDAVRNLMTALENNDVIGVLESLPPGERSALGDPIKDVLGELQRLEILADFDLGSVPGFEFEVQDMTMASTSLGADVSAVRFTGGTLTSTMRPRDLPIGETLQEFFDEDLDDFEDADEETETTDLADADFDLVTIREQDGWHVSLFYSIAEGIREQGTRLPDFGSGLDPVGADSPEAAVRGLLDAAMDLDVRGVIGMLPPDEMRVLYDYGPLFADDADEAAAEFRAEDGFEAELRELELRSTGSGDRRRVVIDAFDVAFSTDDGSGITARFGDGCLDMEMNYTDEWESWDSDTLQDTMRMCTDGEVLVNGEVPSTDEWGYSDNPFGVSEDMELPELDWDDYVAVTVVEHQGSWYVSPTRSLFDPMLALLREVDADQLRDIFDSFFFFGMGSSASMQFEEVGGSIDGPDVYEDFDGPDCYAAYEQLDENASDEEWDAASEEVESCLDDYDTGNPGEYDDLDLDIEEYPFEDDLDVDPVFDDPLMNCLASSYDMADADLEDDDDPFSPQGLAYLSAIGDCMVDAGEADHPFVACLGPVLDMANATPEQQEAALPELEACFEKSMESMEDDYYYDDQEFEDVGGAVQ